MLSKQDRDRLSALASAVRRDDPRFADGLTRGRPRAPREYRIRRNSIWLAVAAVLFGIDIAVGDVALALAAGPTVLLGVLACRYPPRLWFRRRA
jgi:hypothetical protein